MLNQQNLRVLLKSSERLRELGPMSRNEWKLLIVSIILLSFWVSEKTLHQIDTTTTTVCAIAILMCPGIGVMNWQQTVNKINWGTLLLFGVGISLGSAFLSTKAAQWLADMIVLSFGLEKLHNFHDSCRNGNILNRYSLRICLSDRSCRRHHSNYYCGSPEHLKHRALISLV